MKKMYVDRYLESAANAFWLNPTGFDEKNAFFCLVGRKYHFRFRRPIANIVFSASQWEQIKNATFTL